MLAVGNKMELSVLERVHLGTNFVTYTTVVTMCTIGFNFNETAFFAQSFIDFPPIIWINEYCLFKQL